MLDPLKNNIVAFLMRQLKLGCMVILFPCSTQLSMKHKLLLINIKIARLYEGLWLKSLQAIIYLINITTALIIAVILTPP